jgi:hypothetical protein
VNRDLEEVGESALIVEVPEAERVVGRDAVDP